MTLHRAVRGVVRSALDVDVIPDEVVWAVEGDDELYHLARAVAELRSADASGDYRQAQGNVEALAERRVRELVGDVGVAEA